MFTCLMVLCAPQNVPFAASLKIIKQKQDSECPKFSNLSLVLTSFLTRRKRSPKRRRKRKRQKSPRRKNKRRKRQKRSSLRKNQKRKHLRRNDAAIQL